MTGHDTDADVPPASNNSGSAFEWIGLSKTFGEKIAVRDANLDMPAGSFCGVVGPNGAGKTTTIAMATGLLRPDSGHARIFGIDIWANPIAAKEQLGALPDDLALPERLTGRELLTYLGLLHGLDRPTVADRAASLLSVLGLDVAERTPISGYSSGMRKKIGLASALLHGPRLLVLDEPFEAVDPISAATIRTILEQFVTNGGSVMISSHVLALVEQLCDHVAVVVEGAVVAAGPLDQVRAGGSLESRLVGLAAQTPPDPGRLTWLAS